MITETKTKIKIWCETIILNIVQIHEAGTIVSDQIFRWSWPSECDLSELVFACNFVS